MFDRRRIFEIETSKPKSVRTTLARFWKQFKGQRLMLLLVLVLAIFSAWTQVITPDLIGQTVDCYLMPYTQGSASGMESFGQSSQSNCWFDDNTANLSRSETAAGLRTIIALLVGLFLASSFATGLICACRCLSIFTAYH
jgi:ATP-binding cassette subfamily B multidrug efflux pump